MNQQMKKGVIEYAILRLLNDKEYYGYELSQYINEYIKFKESSIYIILSRLEQHGYLNVRKDKSRVNNKIVKYYNVSESGVEYLEDMTNEWKKIGALVRSTVKKEHMEEANSFGKEEKENE